MDLLKMFLQGGVIMWPILLSSIIGVAIYIDRLLVLRKAKMNVPKFMVTIRNYVKRKDIDGAISHCIAERTPAANMIRKGLRKFHLGHLRVREAIEVAGKQEVAKLEKGISVLATVSGIAPLLGFLGTVTGMISAFMRIEELKGSANPSDLAGGIWEALITTAFGLGVGILALISYNSLLNRINKLVSQMEAISNEVADFVEETMSGLKSDQPDEELEQS